MTTPGILVRTLACFLLVFATWNPSGYSFVAWVRFSPWATVPEIAVAGILLLGLHILFLRIAWLSLGADGISAALTIILAGMLTLYEFDLIDPWRRVICVSIARPCSVSRAIDEPSNRIEGAS